PSFTAGGNVAVDEDSGAYSAAWATAISAGPNEAGQTVHFIVANNNNALFSAQPSISPAGVLTFTPAPNANGSTTVTVSLHLNANGSFSFVPAAGVGSATFQYTVTDAPACGAPASATGTVSLTFSPMIWYVNGSAAPGGDGTSTAPFNSFTPLNGAGGLGD